jgi:hypothetical protein
MTNPTPPALSRSCCDESFAVETSVGKVPCPTHFMEYMRKLAGEAEAAPPRATTPTHRCACGFEGDFSAVMAHGVTERHAFGPVAVMGERPRATTVTDGPPMSVVRHQILHEMLDTPPVTRPPEPDWRVIARELMEEIDRRGDALAQRAPLAAHPATTPTREQIEALIAAGRDEPQYVPTYTTASSDEPPPSRESGALPVFSAATWKAKAKAYRNMYLNAIRREYGYRNEVATLERDAARMREMVEKARDSWSMVQHIAERRGSADVPVATALAKEYADEFRAALTPSGEPTTTPETSGSVFVEVSEEKARGLAAAGKFYRCQHGVAPFACTCGHAKPIYGYWSPDLRAPTTET